MTSRIKRYIICLVLFLNIYLLFVTRPSVERIYMDLERQNEIVLDKIESIKSRDKDREYENIYYKSDNEFYMEVEEILKGQGIEGYSIGFLESQNLEDIIKSDVLLSFTCNFLKLNKVIEEIKIIPMMNLKSINLHTDEDGNLNSELVVSIKSDFNNIFRSENNLINRQAFKVRNIEGKSLVEVINNESEENNKDKDIKVELESTKESLKEDIIGTAAISNINNYHIGDLYFQENEYENIEKLKDELYIFSFNISERKDYKKYIGERKIFPSSLLETSILEFWINTSIIDLEIGVELELLKDGETYKKDYMFSYVGKGWQYFSREIEDMNIVAGRLFILIDKATRGSVLIDKFNVRGLNTDE